MISVLPSAGPCGRNRLVLQTTGPEETEALAALFAGMLAPGSVLSLNGGLGAGKTAFTRGLARGLSCRGQVASPTFTLLMEHPPVPGGMALYHFDVYRLDSAGAADEFQDMGLDEYFDAGGVCVIEWGDKVAALLPDRTVRLHMEQPDEDGQCRRIVIAWPAGASQAGQLAERVCAWHSGRDET